VLLLAGCVSHEIIVEPASVYSARDAILGGSGALLVTGDGEPHKVLPDDKVEIVDLAGHRQKFVVNALLAYGVESGAAYVVVGHDHRMPHAAKVALGTTLVVGGLGGLIYCAAECGSPGNYLSGTTLALIGTGLVAITVMAVRALGTMH
jgi:hypothetical protein